MPLNQEEKGKDGHLGTRAPGNGLMPKPRSNQPVLYTFLFLHLKMESVGLNMSMNTWAGQPGLVPRALI